MKYVTPSCQEEVKFCFCGQISQQFVHHSVILGLSQCHFITMSTPSPCARQNSCQPMHSRGVTPKWVGSKVNGQNALHFYNKPHLCVFVYYPGLLTLVKQSSDKPCTVLPGCSGVAINGIHSTPLPRVNRWPDKACRMSGWPQFKATPHFDVILDVNFCIWVFSRKFPTFFGTHC